MEYNEDTLTQAVVERLGKTPDPRLRQILQSAVKHRVAAMERPGAAAAAMAAH